MNTPSIPELAERFQRMRDDMVLIAKWVWDYDIPVKHHVNTIIDLLDRCHAIITTPTKE